MGPISNLGRDHINAPVQPLASPWGGPYPCVPPYIPSYIKGQIDSHQPGLGHWHTLLILYNKNQMAAGLFCNTHATLTHCCPRPILLSPSLSLWKKDERSSSLKSWMYGPLGCGGQSGCITCTLGPSTTTVRVKVNASRWGMGHRGVASLSVPFPESKWTLRIVGGQK